MRKFSLIVIYILLVSSCQSQNKEIKFYNDLEISNISVDTLYLNIPNDYLIINGFLRVLGNKIYFFDPNNFHVLIYDLNGRLLDVKMGEGEGPTEIMGFDYHGFDYINNRHHFFSTSYHFNEFNLNFDKREKEKFFNWPQRKVEYDDIAPDDINRYDFNYGHSGVDTKWLSVTTDQKMILPLNIVWRVSPKFNTQDHPSDFFENGFPLGFYDIKENKLIKGFGNYPDRYQKDKYLTSFSYSYTAILDDNIYVSFNADHRIRIYDNDGNLLGEFGSRYSGIKDDYPLTRNRQEYYDNVKRIKSNYGFYGHVYGCEETGLLFRSIVLERGKSAGLQIYQNKNLLWEGEVPFRFNVIGKYGDWYYADGIIEEESESLAIYRFKLID